MLSRISRLFISMPKRKAQSAFYAVANGHTKGVFSTWAECQEQINGFSSAKFKKFETQEEAQAFVDSGPTWTKSTVPAKKPKVDEPAKKTEKATTSSSKKPDKGDKFYAVAKGHSTGVFLTWPECQAAITGYKSGPKFKKFSTRAEAEAFVDGSWVNDVPTVEKVKRGSPVPSDTPTVYTDGSCLNNGKSANVTAGYGVFWGDSDPRNKAARLSGDVQTNNRAEIQACIHALETAQSSDLPAIRVATDSEYTIKCVNEWMKGWEKKGWKTSTGSSVKNVDLLTRLSDLCKQVKVEWIHVSAHVGIHGNEMADGLANEGARMAKVE